MKKINLACIIDDDPIHVFGTKKIMQLANICQDFMVFHNGEEALRKLSALVKGGENIPEVILLDLNMPIMDGWEFLEAFTKIPTQRKVHIYIVSSSLSVDDINRAKNMKNVNNYIIKPIALEYIKEIVNDL
ncbi:MAG: response regulator [Aequorivita sp.]|nr:response regulator [Aequorivita sp.]|tara:strand:+ start:111551 stop:111943 length:393 start_codon:yes stop_codon:yes gene_type:complete